MEAPAALVTVTADQLGAVEYIKAGAPAPFNGFIFTREDTEEVVAVLGRYSAVTFDLATCQRELAAERTRPQPFYRRLSFWLPVTCCTFTAGMALALLR